MIKKHLRAVPICRKPIRSELADRGIDGIPSLPLAAIMDAASRAKRPKSIDIRRKARHR